MSRFKRWWTNADYDRETMTHFYEDRPEWSDLPPEIVATSMAFQFYAVGEAFRELWQEVKITFGLDKRGL